MDPSETATASDAPGDVGADADDQPGEQVTLVKTGMVRMWISQPGAEPAKRYRLRRPFFGELKQLRLALEAIQDEIEDKRSEILDLADQLKAEEQAINSDESLSAGQRARKLSQVRKKDRKAARDLFELTEQLYPGWWTKVFETLSVDGMPPELPAWITDSNFVNKLMQHWRQAPLAPG